MKVAFLLNDLQLSGGVGVVIQHARRLSMLDGWDVTLALVREPRAQLAGVRVSPAPARPRARGGADGTLRRRGRDVVGNGVHALRARPTPRYFVQSLEDRFYGTTRPSDSVRHHAGPARRIRHGGPLDPRHLRAPPPACPVLPRSKRNRQAGLRAAPGLARADEGPCGPHRGVAELMVQGGPRGDLTAAAMREAHQVTVVPASATRSASARR